MDIEFHYYITYLIASRAGLPPPEALILAWASQYTDDNTMIFTIDAGRPTEYTNYISQTANILKPRQTLMRIYPLFHFIPGDPQAPTAWRKDGAMHWLNTTPGSENANLILDAALATGDLYRIGIACHAYADTWAHQNFVGYSNEFNALTDILFTAVVPNVGHADALFHPDEATRRWHDPRLIHGPIDNKARCLAAAAALYRKLARFVAPDLPPEEIDLRAAALRDDLAWCMAGVRSFDLDGAGVRSAAGVRSFDLASRSDAKLKDLTPEGLPPEGLKALTPEDELKALTPDVDSEGDVDPVALKAPTPAIDPDVPPDVDLPAQRHARYRHLASSSPSYGGRAIPPYDPDLWMDEAINEHVHGLRDRSDFILACLDPWPDTYTWKDRVAYRWTPWYRFQEAVKSHQNESWQLLTDRNFLGLDLADL